MLATDRIINTEPEKCAGCLRCQLICSFQHTGAFNPSQTRIRIVEDDHGVVEICFTEECDRCGSCVKYCAYDALKLERKG